MEMQQQYSLELSNLVSRRTMMESARLLRSRTTSHFSIPGTHIAIWALASATFHVPNYPTPQVPVPTAFLIHVFLFTFPNRSA